MYDDGFCDRERLDEKVIVVVVTAMFADDDDDDNDDDDDVDDDDVEYADGYGHSDGLANKDDCGGSGGVSF